MANGMASKLNSKNQITTDDFANNYATDHQDHRSGVGGDGGARGSYGREGNDFPAGNVGSTEDEDSGLRVR